MARITEDLRSHPRLTTILGSLLPGSAASTVNGALSYSNVAVNHVVAHGAVRWWAPTTSRSSLDGPDESRPFSSGVSHAFMDTETDTCFSASHHSLSLHHSAAQHLLPRLQATDTQSTYTFVTGESGLSVSYRDPAVVVGSRMVQGVAECVRQEVAGMKGVTSAEVRVGMAVDRPAEDRAKEPRAVPLSSEVGDIVAGIASSQREVEGLYYLKSPSVLKEVKEMFPVKGGEAGGMEIQWHYEGAGKVERG